MRFLEEVGRLIGHDELDENDVLAKGYF
ncbi:MAG: hypothetical protein M3498_09170 [Deinococcota bacterium]|nr:hypothetical protein [Deinococcota bacterium]